MNSEQARTLRRYIAIGSGISSSNCIPANDGYPLPSGLFAAVLIQDTNAEGTPTDYQWDADTEIQKQEEQRHALVQIQWFRRGGMDAAQRFHDWVVSDMGLIEARAIGLVSEPSTITDVSQIVTDDWEERAAMTLSVSYVRETEQTIRRIERVGGGGVGVFHEG